MSFVFKRTAEWWLLLCVVSVESSSAHVVAVMLRTMFSIQRNSSSKFWSSKLKCLEFDIHQNIRTYQFHVLNQDLHQNVFQFHFIKLCHISQTIIPWFDPALFANITLFKVNKSGNSFKSKQNNQNFACFQKIISFLDLLGKSYVKIPIIWFFKMCRGQDIKDNFADLAK